MRFDQALLTEIRERIDIVALIGASVALKKAGTTHKGLCPFHEENTASFTVSDVRRRYHCFGCGATGDVFEWLVEHDGLDFVAAVKQLAERARVALPDAEPAKKKATRKRAARRSRQPGQSAPADDATAKERTAGTEHTDAEHTATSAAEPPASGLAAGFRALEMEGEAETPAAPEAAGVEAAIPLPRPELLPLFDVDDLTRMWGQLGEVPATWASAVRTWAIERGLGPVVADILPTLGEVAAVPVGRVPPELAAMVARLRWEPLDLWVPVRDAAGTIVDIQRRYVRGGKAPASLPTKTARLRSDPHHGEHPPHIPRPPETVVFGRIAAAVEAAARGEPVVVVEGEADYLLAAACCVARGRGAALGVPGKGHRKVASALVLAVQRYRRPRGGRIEPGSWDCYVVPDIDDNGGGERAMWSAGVQLLDVARVTWCPPARWVDDTETIGKRTRVHLVRGDLTDAIKDSRDPVVAFWEMLKDGARIYESVDAFESDPKAVKATLEMWRGATDEELARAFYRMPWRDVVEYMRWYLERDEEGNPVKPARSFYHGTIDHRDGTDRVQDMLDRWLAAQGIRFAADRSAKAAVVYDPWRRASLKPRDRGLPRVINVGSRRDWLGWLGTIGINPRSVLGGMLNTHIQQQAQAAQRARLMPWLTTTGSLRKPRIHMHLHGLQEEVVVVERDVVHVETNGSRRDLILEALDDDLVCPIEWVPRTTPTDAARLLWDTIGQYLTVAHRERVLAVSWALMAFLRDTVTDRPALWGTGASESGKSFLGRLLMALLTGHAVVFNITPAALWALATMQPLIPCDNQEARHLHPAAEEFFLNILTGGGRIKRAEDERSVVVMKGRPMVHISAIARPPNRELGRRCILIEHHARFRSTGMRASEVIEAVLAARSAILSGVCRAFAEYVIPRLNQPYQAGDPRRHHEVYADVLPPDHPNSGMREPLGIMAVIATWLCEADPRWGRGGVEMVQGWSSLLHARATMVMRHNDPLAAALDELAFAWNRITTDSYGQQRRPAVDDALFQCKPLYETQPQHNVRGDNPYTSTESHAEVPSGGGPPVVVGFEGTYVQLHRDLTRVADRSFTDLFASGHDVSSHIQTVDSWRSLGACHRKGRRGLRVYQWVQVDGPSVEGDTEEEGVL